MEIILGLAAVTLGIWLLQLGVKWFVQASSSIELIKSIIVCLVALVFILPGIAFILDGM